MILANGSRGRMVAREVVDVRSRLGRLRGLVGRPLAVAGVAYLFRAPAVHTFGARGAVDLAYLDAKLRVVAVARDRPPNRAFAPPDGAAAVLVAAAGSFRPEIVDAGDRLEWIPRTSERVAGGAGIPPEFAHLVRELPPLPREDDPDSGAPTRPSE